MKGDNWLMKRVITITEIEELLTDSPYHQFLGIQLKEITNESLTIKLPFKETFITGNDDGYIHGGLLATIIDIAGYFAIFQFLNQPVPTIDLRIDYLRAARREDLFAEATVVKLGRSVSVADIVVTNADSKKIAVGRGLYSTIQTDKK